MRAWLAILSASLLALNAAAASAAQVEGDYIEARTADVFTGPCFSNSEVFITGHQAVLAWRVRAGTWAGEDLGGLTVAAAIQATSTFSEDRPADARAVVIVDQRATPKQRAALVDLARHLAGDRLQNIVAVRDARMSLTVESDMTADHPRHGTMPHAPLGSFWAAGLAEIVTRPLDETDHACGNEVVAYEPLSKGVTAAAAYTLGHKFRGDSLRTSWSDPNCRSSFVGRFAY